MLINNQGETMKLRLNKLREESRKEYKNSWRVYYSPERSKIWIMKKGHSHPSYILLGKLE